MNNKGFYTILDPKGKDIGLRVYDEEDMSGVIRWYRNENPAYIARKAVGFQAFRNVVDESDLPDKTWYWTSDGAGHRTTMPTHRKEEAIDLFNYHRNLNPSEVLIAVTEWKAMPLLGVMKSEAK